LSEQAAFARACADAGITFIGPDPHAMSVMGDKVRARQAMQAAEVPLVPGREDLGSADDAVAAAAEIGYPLMLKAAAGGGGKGMRIVHDDAQLRRGFEAARREATAAFGDGRIFAERAVLAARHVEIQVMADRHGNVVALNERDCSVQRRHQKVIEEAPSPSRQMTPEVRAAMGEVACRVAQSVGYVGAGTVEFLYEETASGPRFYFLEMNTRLQVEHPVTEAITGRDLVWDQIRVAAGEPLGYGAGDVAPRGHALECRIYAEDPVRFLPSPGRISTLVWPTGPNVRIDAAVAPGDEVRGEYDPMIAKLCVWGPTRAEAIATMRRALDETVILGIATNLAFHRRALAEPDFVAGTFTTRFIDDHPAVLAPQVVDPEAVRAAVAAAAVARAAAVATAPVAPAVAAFSAWRRAAKIGR
jgi:acetyl/propionyl-CoA carboxylase alpha subunit